jgi:hypothetical protein
MFSMAECRRLLIALSILCGTIGTVHAFLGRVVQFDILLDGKTILVAGHLDDGGAKPDEVWRELSELDLRNPARRFVLSEEETERLMEYERHLESMAKDNRVKIEGKIRIFCRYGGDITVDALTLLRKDVKSPWRIDSRQVLEMMDKRFVDPQRRTMEQLDRAREIEAKSAGQVDR